MSFLWHPFYYLWACSKNRFVRHQKDKRRELFDKGKLLNGIRKAFEKRPVAANTIDKIADDIEAGLYKQGRQEVQSAIIGDMVMNSL